MSNEAKQVQDHSGVTRGFDKEVSPLTPEQNVVFIKAMHFIALGLNTADTSRAGSTRLLAFGDVPELFDTTLTDASLEDNAMDGMEPVVQALVAEIESRGYTATQEHEQGFDGCDSFGSFAWTVTATKIPGSRS